MALVIEYLHLQDKTDWVVSKALRVIFYVFNVFFEIWKTRLFTLFCSVAYVFSDNDSEGAVYKGSKTIWTFYTVEKISTSPTI